MSFLRYQELRLAGPTITAEDVERLKTFRPRLSPLAAWVRVALARITHEAKAAQ